MKPNRPVLLILLLAIALPLSAAENSGVRLPATRVVTLPNGARLVLVEKREVPMISLSAWIRGGAVTDPEGRHGLASITAEMLQKGAGKRSAVEIASAVESLGANLSTWSGREAIFVTADFMSKDAPAMIGIISDVILRPTFDVAELEKVKQRTIESISAAKDSDLRRLNGTYFASWFFGDHPYGNPPSGTETSIAAITRDDVLRFYRDHLGGDRLVLAVVGDFDAARMESQLRSAFGDWKKAEARPATVPAVKPASGRRVLLVDKPDATQTYFWIGNSGISRTDADRVAVDLANTYFGGRFTSLLNSALRIRSGLTYGARSVVIQESQPGPLAIASYTKTESTTEAIDMALGVLSEFREKGLDDEALASVKAYVLGQFPPDLETSGQLADRLAEIAFYGLDASDVNAYAATVNRLTTADLKKTIDRVYPSEDDLTFVLIGNAAAIRDGVKKYGKVEEMKITDPKFRP